MKIIDLVAELASEAAVRLVEDGYLSHGIEVTPYQRHLSRIIETGRRADERLAARFLPRISMVCWRGQLQTWKLKQFPALWHGHICPVEWHIEQGPHPHPWQRFKAWALKIRSER